MNVFIAGTMSRPYVFMDLFLAGGISGKTGIFYLPWDFRLYEYRRICKGIEVGL